MPARATTANGAAPFDVSAIAALSSAELMELAAASSRQMASLAGLIALVGAELDRREGWREEGATSLPAWLVERCGVSVPTARAWAHVGERLFDLPVLAAGLSSGELSFDKVRAVVDRADPESDAALCAQAARCSVRQLGELARSAAVPSEAVAAAAEEARTLRFNDAVRTVSAQLPPADYAEVRSCLEARAKATVAPEGTRLDQRLADAFMALVRHGGTPSPSAGPSARSSSSSSSSPSAASSGAYLVVAHTPLATLAEEGSALCGELEHHGLISAETVRRLACEGAVVVAIDDDVGHTMYEGRARRDPTGAQRRELFRRDRHCRFPGCANATFVHPHHLAPWKPGGPTDLDNLVLLCEHHHRRIHSSDWRVEGDANAELRFVGPSGRVMVSLPSPLWTRVSAPGPRAKKAGTD